MKPREVRMEHTIERLCAFLWDAVGYWDALAKDGRTEGERAAAEVRARVARNLISEAGSATNSTAN
jgi:hypothetical protein